MDAYGGLVELQGRAWVLVEMSFGLGKELAGGGELLAFHRDTLLVLCGALPVDRERRRAECEHQQHRQDGDRPAAAPPVAADAGRQEVPGAGAELDAVGDQDPSSAWPRAHR